jgi:hypothetical protein
VVHIFITVTKGVKIYKEELIFPAILLAVAKNQEKQIYLHYENCFEYVSHS